MFIGKHTCVHSKTQLCQDYIITILIVQLKIIKKFIFSTIIKKSF